MCFNKRGFKPSRCVSVKEIIRDNVIEGFLGSDERLPCGICKKCLFDLFKSSNEDEISFTVST